MATSTLFDELDPPRSAQCTTRIISRRTTALRSTRKAVSNCLHEIFGCWIILQKFHPQNAIFAAKLQPFLENLRAKLEL